MVGEEQSLQGARGPRQQRFAVKRRRRAGLTIAHLMQELVDISDFWAARLVEAHFFSVGLAGTAGKHPGEAPHLEGGHA